MLVALVHTGRTAWHDAKPTAKPTKLSTEWQNTSHGLHRDRYVTRQNICTDSSTAGDHADSTQNRQDVIRCYLQCKAQINSETHLPYHQKYDQCRQEVIRLVVQQIVQHSVCPFLWVFDLRDLKSCRFQQKIAHGPQRRQLYFGHAVKLYTLMWIRLGIGGIILNAKSRERTWFILLYYLLVVLSFANFCSSFSTIITMLPYQDYVMCPVVAPADIIIVLSIPPPPPPTWY